MHKELKKKLGVDAFYFLDVLTKKASFFLLLQHLSL